MDCIPFVSFSKSTDEVTIVVVGTVIVDLVPSRLISSVDSDVVLDKNI